MFYAYLSLWILKLLWLYLHARDITHMSNIINPLSLFTSYATGALTGVFTT